MFVKPVILALNRLEDKRDGNDTERERERKERGERKKEKKAKRDLKTKVRERKIVGVEKSGFELISNEVISDFSN